MQRPLENLNKSAAEYGDANHPIYNQTSQYMVLIAH